MENKLVEDSEFLVIMKTTKENVDHAVSELSRLHNYEAPEILCIDAECLSDRYFGWLTSVVERNTC